MAVDLGATSGRTILGSVEKGQLIQSELTRFPNRITQLGGHFYWDIYALYDEVIRALRVVADEGIRLQSIGIDTWGVDFVCVGKDGNVLRNPFSYRDPHTEGIMEEFFQKKVFLQLFVKVDPDWRESRKELRRFGYEE